MDQNIKHLIRELVDEVLDEMTGTGAVAGYQTPNAFQGQGDAARKKKIAQRSMPGGKVVGENDDESLPIVRRDAVAEGRGRYYNYRENDEMKTHGKISYGIAQSSKMLSEVEFLIGICERLKTESGTPNDRLWKRTRTDIGKIHHRLKEIARRINRLGK